MLPDGRTTGNAKLGVFRFHRWQMEPASGLDNRITNGILSSAKSVPIIQVPAVTNACNRLLPVFAMLLGASCPASLLAVSVDPMMVNVITWPDPSLNLRRSDGAPATLPAGPWFDAPSWAGFNPDSKVVQACGLLKNPLHAPLAIHFFSANLSSPLLLLPEEDDVLKRKPRSAGDPPLPPPVPPPQMQFNMPARGAVRICAETSLAAFDYRPGGEARIRWHFEWKNPPAGYQGALQGTLTIRLP